MLACFGTKYERDQLAKACDNCWVGYTWKEGIKNDIFELRSFILLFANEIIVIDQHTYIFIRFVEADGDYCRYYLSQ